MHLNKYVLQENNITVFHLMCSLWNWKLLQIVVKAN